MQVTPGVSTVFKVCERGHRGEYLTLLCKWQDSRQLPARQWLIAEPFTYAENGVNTELVGFSAFTSLDACRLFYNRFVDRDLAILECKASGVYAHPLHNEEHSLCLQIKLGSEVT